MEWIFLKKIAYPRGTIMEHSTINTFSKIPDFVVYTCPSPIFFQNFLKFSNFFQ